MHTQTHRLLSSTPGTTHELVSLHYGTPGQGPKTLIQASVHADEVPAMLVAQHLRRRLQALEDEGRLSGEIVLVPVANPLGLSQRLLQLPVGRFDLDSGENFNRHYADLLGTVTERVEGRLGEDTPANVALVREALRQACAGLPAASALQHLRRCLLGLAIDADTVLDLHCDNQAVLHLYTATPLWPEVEPLARLLGCAVSLLATHSGDNPFDEACSMLWPRLSEALAERDPDSPALPAACVAVTVELRGELDVAHELAAADCEALLAWLALRGQIRGTLSQPVTLTPALVRPLAGSMPVLAPHGGVLVFLANLGQHLRAGQPLAELIDPMSGASSTLTSPVDGLFYACDSRRFVPAGTRIAKIAGEQALRQGKLLSA